MRQPHSNDEAAVQSCVSSRLISCYCNDRGAQNGANTNWNLMLAVTATEKVGDSLVWDVTRTEVSELV